MVTHPCKAGVDKEGRQTMESAWKIMELHFWDEKSGLYQVQIYIQTLFLLEIPHSLD